MCCFVREAEPRDVGSQAEPGNPWELSCYRFPPEIYNVSPVIQAESADARKTAAGAMSCGWPIRPSGVCASICLRKSLSAMPGRVDALGLDHAGVDRVDADLARAQLLGERPRHGVDGRLGRAVDRRVRQARPWRPPS